MNLKDQILGALGDEPKPKKKGAVVVNEHGQEAALLTDDEGKTFPDEQSHIKYYRAKALQDPKIKAEYDEAEALNKSGDAILALRGHLPAYKKPAVRVKAKETPDLKYAYQTDRTSTPMKGKRKLNEKIQTLLAGDSEN